MSDLFRAAQAVDSAIRNQGISPRYHRNVHNKSMREWPTLWRALANLQQALTREKQRMENDPRNKAAHELYDAERRHGDVSWYNLPAPVRRLFLDRIAPAPDMIDREDAERALREALEAIAIDSLVIDELIARFNTEMARIQKENKA